VAEVRGASLSDSWPLQGFEILLRRRAGFQKSPGSSAVTRPGCIALQRFRLRIRSRGMLCGRVSPDSVACASKETTAKLATAADGGIITGDRATLIQSCGEQRGPRSAVDSREKGTGIGDRGQKNLNQTAGSNCFDDGARATCMGRRTEPRRTLAGSVFDSRHSARCAQPTAVAALRVSCTTVV